MHNGILALSFWGHVVALLLLTHVTIVAVTVYLHRHQAHRSLDLHPALAHFFRFWLWLTTGMRTRDWVAIHRKHHAYCETEDDPHSPQVLGLRTVFWRGAELYQSAAADDQTMRKFSRGTPDDWLERNVYSRFGGAGLGLMLVIDLLLFGVAGVAIWALQMIWIPFWAAGVINGLGHYFGYRNFECEDAATNIVPLGLLVGGEELHNNHHAFPSSARFSQKRWEFDLGWLYIRLFSALGLARVRKLAPRPRNLAGEPPALDAEAAKTLFANRMHLLADYSRRVLRPVMRAERPRLPRARRGLARLVLRERSLLDEPAMHRLTQVLRRSPRLQTAYHYQERLKSIWESSGQSYESFACRLREWCVQAESSGIESLQRFARRLRAYGSAAPAVQ